MRFTVGTNGRVVDCVVTGTSGDAALDAATCDLIKRRVRFRPATNAQGRPIPATTVGSHEWIPERRPDEVIEEEEEEHAH
jgi:protein TonB